MTESRAGRGLALLLRALIFCVLVGSVVGWVKAVSTIAGNGYLASGMSHLAARTVAADVTGLALRSLLIALAGTAAALIAWAPARLLLGGWPRGLRASVLAVLVALPLLPLALWLNREHLPGMFELPSLAANGGLVVGAFLVWRLALAIWDGLAGRGLPRGLGWVTGWAPAAILVLAVLLALAAPMLAPAPDTSGRPDVVVLLVDALRHDRLGAYDYHRDTSPHIDSLAREGWTFTQAIAPASWTKPSIASLFTGLYPHQHGIGSGSWSRTAAGGEVRVDVLAPELDTLAELMANGGYRTVAVGHNQHLTGLTGFDQGFDDYIWNLKDDVTFITADKMHDRFLGWLDAGSGSAFSYLHYIDVHWPYLAPEPFRGTLSGPPPALDYNHPEFMDRAQADARSGTLRLDDEVLTHMSDSYDELIRYVDAEIGELLNDLRARGTYDSSLIILTADHGEEFLEHGQLAHGTSVYDVLLRIPLIVKWPCPGELCESRVIDDQVELIDLFPTILQQAGLEVPDTSQGHDLAQPVPAGRLAFGERGDFVALRTPTEKYIYSLSSQSQELYDLVADPQEKQNLVGERSERAHALNENLLEWIAETTVVATGGRQVTVDEKTLEKLRALGYVE